MSEADNTSELESFFARDHYLPDVTATEVARALSGFPLPLQQSRDMAWLAMAVRRSLAKSIPHISDGPNRTSNSEVQAELKRLAAIAQSTWRELFECDPAAEDRMWNFASQRWDGEGGTEIDGLAFGEPSEHRRFKAAVAELDWLAGFLRQAARTTEKQYGPWRQSEGRRLRITRALYLAPIFEVAFGQPISVNNWPSDAVHKSPTPFMDFYQRMVRVAFGEAATPDLSGVLKTARQLHVKAPAKFNKDLIPGLPSHLLLP